MTATPPGLRIVRPRPRPGADRRSQGVRGPRSASPRGPRGRVSDEIDQGCSSDDAGAGPGLRSVLRGTGADGGAARRSRRQTRDRRAREDPRRRSRGQPRRECGRPGHDRVPAAELREGQVAALPGRVRAARLLHRRRAVGRRDPRAADDRRRARPGRRGDDRRAARLEDGAQRLHVLELGDDRRLRAVHRPRRGRLRRRALPDHSRSSEPRAGGPLDGGVRRHPHRHEAPRGVRQPVHHEPVLPGPSRIRPGRARTSRRPSRA